MSTPSRAAQAGEPQHCEPGTPQDLSQQAHRRLIGYLGLLLPILLYVLAGARPTAGLPSWVLLESISSYYYTGAVAVFVGVLFALSLFLFTYRGYAGMAADRVAGAIGGACALGVAAFPTIAPPVVPGPGQTAPVLTEPSWWTPVMETIHYVSAASLFLVFIVFSLWLFRKSGGPRAGMTPGKRARNTIYLACGIVMIGAVVWAGIAGPRGQPIFWPEAIALWAFAISWLVKGKAHTAVIRVVKRAVGAGGAGAGAE